MDVDARLATYLSLTTLLALTPGATTAVVVRNALAGGRRTGFAAAIGAAAGNATQAAASGLGLALLLGRVPAVLLILRVAGALYLAWLGMTSLTRIFGERRPLGREGHSSQTRSAFRQGLVTNLLNPPIITFYLVIVPSFLPADAGPRHFAALAAMHIAIALVCHAGWAMAFDRLRTLFAKPAFGRALEVGTGVALLILAARTLITR